MSLLLLSLLLLSLLLLSLLLLSLLFTEWQRDTERQIHEVL